MFYELDCPHCHRSNLNFINYCNACEQPITEATCLHLFAGTFICHECYLKKNDFWHERVKEAKPICVIELKSLTEPDVIKRYGWNHLDCTLYNFGIPNVNQQVQTFDLSTIRTILIDRWQYGLNEFIEALFSNPSLTNVECVKITNSDYQLTDLYPINRLQSKPKIIVDQSLYMMH